MKKNSKTNFQNSKAFTLAEVLVTIGIIGVVAAMTLPSVISHYKKKVLLEQFRVAYSLLQQAYLKIELDLGYTPACFYWRKNPYPTVICTKHDEYGACKQYTLPDGSPLPKDYNGGFTECSFLYNTLEKELQVVQKCENKAYEKGCIPKYEGNDTIQKQYNPDISEEEAASQTSSIGGYRQKNILERNPAYVFKNGMIMSLFSISNPMFLLDINGKSGPNKWGYDVFPFTIRSDGHHGLKLEGSTYTVEKGGVSTSEMIKNMNRKYSDK